MKPNPAPVPHYRWNELPQEPLRGTISRWVVTGERMMIAHVYLKKNDDVPRHSHDNEQIIYVLEGALHFWFGEDGAEELTVRAGEVIVIPSFLAHRALALEHTSELQSRVDLVCRLLLEKKKADEDYFHDKHCAVALSGDGVIGSNQ